MVWTAPCDPVANPVVGRAAPHARGSSPSIGALRHGLAARGSNYQGAVPRSFPVLPGRPRLKIMESTPRAKATRNLAIPRDA